MKIDNTTFMYLLAQYCKNKFPEKFEKKLKRVLARNNIVEDAQNLYNYCKFFDLNNYNSTVHSFAEFSKHTYNRESAIIDTVVFDLIDLTKLRIKR